jgi:hypothetical protein
MQELNEELNKTSNCLSFRLLQMKCNSRKEEARIQLSQHEFKYFKISFSLFLNHKNAHIYFYCTRTEKNIIYSVRVCFLDCVLSKVRYNLTKNNRSNLTKTKTFKNINNLHFIFAFLEIKNIDLK